MWKLWAHEKPKQGVRFVGLFNDGSGGNLYKVVNYSKGIIHDESAEWIDTEYLDETILYWVELPEGYKLWEEQ